jgi:hypothetical protein
VEGLRKRVSGEQSDHDVNVIRHDAPREEAIALLVEVAEGFTDDRSDCRRVQMACTSPTVQELLDASCREACEALSFVGRNVAA